MVVMEMVEWFRTRFGSKPRPHFPAMFRVRDGQGRFVEQVEMVGTFEPGGRPLSKRQVTASGLCMVHWPKQAESLKLEIRAGAERAALEVSTRRAEPDRVIEVQLS